MATPLGRRNFLKQSLAATVTAPLIMSLEEHALIAEETGKAKAKPVTPPVQTTGMPTGVIGKVKISRLICGGNLINGYAHSRDLIYMSTLLKNYFTDDKIMETWAQCERHGINTMICFPGDVHAVEIYRKYIAQGGRIQYLAQIAPQKKDLKSAVMNAVDNGASGAFLVGNQGDTWAREGSVGLIGELIAMIKAQGLIAGVAGHELRTPMLVEKAGIEADFYMKTLHSTNYWSRQQPQQKQDVIDNGNDNYWCRDPEETIAFMRAVKRPWIAYKVLAAGAIHPRDGFRHAFESGADFAVVGMFDFQVAEDARTMTDLFARNLDRARPWLA